MLGTMYLYFQRLHVCKAVTEGAEEVTATPLRQTNDDGYQIGKRTIGMQFIRG